MRQSKGKILGYLFIALASLFFINNFSKTGGNFNFLETSLLSILKNVAEDNQLRPPDLAIGNATLRKISDPTEGFPYYKYYANIVLENYGGDLKNAKIVISAGDDQKYEFVKNSADGFSLEAGKSYILDRYDVIFDSNYNGGEITINVDVKDQNDANKSNNSFGVSVFEQPPKLEAVTLEKITAQDGRGSFEISFNPVNTALNLDQFEIISSDRVDFESNEEKYAEITAGDRIYGYHRIKNPQGVLNSNEWKKEAKSLDEVKKIEFNSDPFNDETTHYFYVKATNQETGYYAVSNILNFGPQKELSRAEFAKLFLDYADVEISNEGKSFYKDVSDDVWYSPYVKTLYNLGLISSAGTNYYPDKIMSRGEALRVVLDYFDVDLADDSDGGNDNDFDFENISKNDYLYPYLKALYLSGKGSVFGKDFHPDLPATKDFLKYLIYEYT